MKRITFFICTLVFGFSLVNQAFAETHRHGEVKTNHQQQLVIWSATSNKWKNIEAFWLEYANEQGGLTWGKTAVYPQYNKVKEHDTILIEVDEGVCLMEFFHERWRRANDVRRWNEALTQYSGCPYVFD